MMSSWFIDSELVGQKQQDQLCEYLGMILFDLIVILGVTIRFSIQRRNEVHCFVFVADRVTVNVMKVSD